MPPFISAVDEYMPKEQNLIYNFRKLNKSGHEEATKRVEELTEIPRYRGRALTQSETQTEGDGYYEYI